MAQHTIRPASEGYIVSLLVTGKVDGQIRIHELDRISLTHEELTARIIGALPGPS